MVMTAVLRAVCRAPIDPQQLIELRAIAARRAAAERQQAVWEASIAADDARFAANRADTATWDALPPYEQPSLPPPGPGAPVPGQWDALDHVSALDCLVSPCSHLRDVPSVFRADWARAHVDVFDYIAAARAAHDEIAVDRGLKWYLVLHDVLLRSRRRGGVRVAQLLGERFQLWRDGNRRMLVRLWEDDRRSAYLASCLRRRLSSEERASQAVGRAMQLFEEGQLSRAMRVLHSSGLLGITPEILQQLQRVHRSAPQFGIVGLQW
jgi:hypothetical protein